MNLPTRHPYDSVQDFKRQDFNALYSIQPTQLTCLLHTLTATTIDKISHFHQIHSLHNFIHQHDHFEREDLHNHNEKRSLIFSTFITKVKLKQQKAPRVNILAKTSNFSPSSNKNMPISSLIFLTNTSTNLHGIFRKFFHLQHTIARIELHMARSNEKFSLCCLKLCKKS